jgi:hypothetical protein
METANDLIARFITTLDLRQRPMATASTGNCQALISDALPPQARVMATIRNEICPNERCSDVDRAIIGASLGG